MTDKLTVKKQFVIEKIEGKTTLFDVETSTFYSFNESGSFIFGLVKKGMEKRKIVDLLAKKYDLQDSKAKKDVDDFLKDLLKNKIASASKQTGRGK
jgi:hypothetical protein